ncbi:MAG: hypothetical protein NTX52_11450 [Planctomycetota bacterium]|nr:hypothetical protein [Planctomycetota bacterium]
MIIKARLKTQDTTTLPISDFGSARRTADKFWISDFAAFCLLSSVFCVLLLAGCAKQQQYEVATEPLCVTGLGKPAVMKASEDVLAEMHFTIEKADADSGLIRTGPLSGAQFFELWRSDNVGAFNSAESNLHSIRRTVELNMTPQGEKLCLGCNVKVERLFLPEREVSSSQAYQMFSKSTTSLQKLTLNSQQKAGMTWVDLGQDRPLAAEILKRIEQQIATQDSKPK